MTTAHNFQDNIFWNARSNASGAGKNYAITVGGTAPNPAGLTTNFNDLYATGTGGFVGLFNAVDQPALSDWQTATGQDANSISADPKFVAPDAAAATVNLHILPGSPAQLAATAIASVTNDFDNDPRPPVKNHQFFFSQTILIIFPPFFIFFLTFLFRKTNITAPATRSTRMNTSCGSSISTSLVANPIRAALITGPAN